MVDLLKSDFRVFANGFRDQKLRGFRPRKDVPPVMLTPPLDWRMDPLQDRNWRFQLSAWRMLPPIWQNFYGKDWGSLQIEILTWIRDWHDFHISKANQSDFMWQDMATGIRAEHLALIEKLSQDGKFNLNTDDSVMLEDLIVRHAEKLMDPDFISTGNHAIFQLKGLRLLGIVRPDLTQLNGEEEYTSRMMSELLRAQFRENGVHVENSPDYHNFALSNFRYIRPALVPRIAELLESVLRRAELVAPWLTLPNGKATPIGDTEKRGPRLEEPLRYDAYATSEDGIVTIMRDLSDGGYAVVRTLPGTPPHREVMLIVNGQAYVTSHAHADQLGFNLFYRGSPLFVDSGKYSYNNNQWRKYFLSDRAHNVVGLQGMSFGPHDTHLVGSCLDSAQFVDGEGFIIEGQVSRGRSFRHWRKYTYHPSGRICIKDRIECEPGKLPVVYFHLDPHVDVRIEGAVASIARHGVTLARVSIDKGSFVPQIRRGRVNPVIQGWVSPAYSQKIEAAVLEFKSKVPVADWQCQIDLVQADHPYVFSHLPEILGDRANLNFQYVRTVKRHLELDAGASELRLVIEVIDQPLETVGEALRLALEASGYRHQRQSRSAGLTRCTYVNEVGEELRVVVRPPHLYKTTLPKATGSVYFALRPR